MNGVNLANRNAAGSVGHSAVGGQLVRFINNCAGVSVKGAIVSIDTTMDNAVVETAVAGTNPIGVIYQEGVPVGSEVWVAVDGIAEVAFNDNVGTPGDYVRAPAVADAAIAVQEVIVLQWTHAGLSVAGTASIKLPSLPAVDIVTAGGDNADAMAALVQAAAASFLGWGLVTIGDTTTFTQTVGATTDGVMGVTYGTTSTTATIVATALGKPAITPADGIAVADAVIPAAGLQIGILMEDHTARIFAEGVYTARVLIKTN
jgi:hypothetical protein